MEFDLQLNPDDFHPPLEVRSIQEMIDLFNHFIFGATAGSEEPDPLFMSFETLQVTLEAPFRQLMRDRDESIELDGKFAYTDADGAAVELDVKVRTRGKFRAQEDVCEFAPLRLNFRASQVADTLFAGQDKLKLVTHCDTDSNRYEQTVITEYLAYRILNVMTDFSYRVRLLQIRYIFADSNDTIRSYGFLIERDKRVAARLGLERMSVPKLEVADLEADYGNLVSLFQFLIGNTDFSPIAVAEGEDCCHNHTPFAALDTAVYSIPYDFDMCGIVDAPHAKPNRRFRLRDVRQRLYRGRCTNNELLPSTLERYRERRSQLEALINDQAELSKLTRRRTRDYLKSFYRIIDDPKLARKYLFKRCI